MARETANHQLSIFEPREDIWMMESLNEFFDDCEKEYSQQVSIPDSEILQEPHIKKSKFFLDTEKLKENSKINAERAKERHSRLSNRLQESRKSQERPQPNEDLLPSDEEVSSRDEKYSQICENFINLNKVPIKSEEFTLNKHSEMDRVIKQYKKGISKRTGEPSK